MKPPAAGTGVAATALSRPAIWIPAALTLLVLMVYAPSLGSGFIYDDHQLILAPAPPSSVSDLLHPFVDGGRHFVPYYRPLPWFSIDLQRLVHGDVPALFHLANVLLAALLAVAAWRLFRQPCFALPPIAAAGAAALLLVHPVSSSSIFAITGREALMAGLGLVTSAGLFLCGTARARRLALVVYGAALLSREQAIVLPALLLMADLAGLVPAAAPLSRRLMRHAPFAMVSVAYLVIRGQILGGDAGLRFTALESPGQVGQAFLYALQSVATPFAGVIYEPDLDTWFSAPRLALAFIVATTTALLIAGARGARRRLIFWGCWFLLALLPTANIFFQESPFAERHLLLAMTGAAGIAGTLAAALMQRHGGSVWPVGLLAGLLVLSIPATTYRARFFHDDRNFLVRWVTTQPRSAQAHASLGQYFLEKGELDQAGAHLQAALRLQRDTAIAHHLLGVVRMRQGLVRESVGHLRQALVLEPGMPEAHFHLGALKMQRGELDAALLHFETVLRSEIPYLPAETLLNTALILRARGEISGANLRFRDALELARQARDQELTAAIQRAWRVGVVRQPT